MAWAGESLDVLQGRTRQLISLNLRPAEDVIACLCGLEKQALVGTAERILIAKAGRMAGLPRSSRLYEFAYSNVLDLRVLPLSRRIGYVEVRTSESTDAPPMQSLTTNDSRDALKAPNCIEFRMSWLSEYEPMVQRLQSLIASSNSG